LEVEADEERLVPLPAVGAAALGVGGFHALGEFECLLGGDVELRDGGVGSRELLFGVGEFGSEPLLLASKQFGRERVGVVGLQQSVALTVEHVDPGVRSVRLPFVLGP
jgi:hypothetical protein